MFSYNVYLSLEQEEVIADIIATYGEEIINITNKDIAIKTARQILAFALNVNADDAACAIATAMGAEKLAFLTDIEGVYRDFEDKDSFVLALKEMDIEPIFENVEALPYSILFFRALEQWIGGLGVIVVMLRFIMPGSISSKLYQSEARDDKLKPSIKGTTRETLKIYGIFTLSGIILYVLAGMPLFDAVCNTFRRLSVKMLYFGTR